MKIKRYDMASTGRLNTYVADHSQLVAAILSAAAVLLVDLAAIGLLTQVPNRIVATWSPSHGEFIYSFRTEIIFFIDLILFIIFFPIAHWVLKRGGFNDYEE